MGRFSPEKSWLRAKGGKGKGVLGSWFFVRGTCFARAGERREKDEKQWLF